MSDTKTHSPTPWRNEDSGEMARIYDANEKSLFGAEQYHPWVSEPDFPFIVRAVNAHAALVEALKSECVCQKCPEHGYSVCDGCKCGHRAKIAAALKLAGEEP